MVIVKVFSNDMLCCLLFHGVYQIWLEKYFIIMQLLLLINAQSSVTISVYFCIPLLDIWCHLSCQYSTMSLPLLLHQTDANFNFMSTRFFLTLQSKLDFLVKTACKVSRFIPYPILWICQDRQLFKFVPCLCQNIESVMPPRSGNWWIYSQQLEIFFCSICLELGSIDCVFDVNSTII